MTGDIAEAVFQDNKSGLNGHSPDFSTITVTQTYEGYEPWIFKFRRQLSKEQKKSKQEFYDLTKEEQDAQQHSYRVTMMASLLKETPTGIPGYGNGSNGPGIQQSQYFKYFISEDMEDVHDFIFNVYQSKLYPKEILSAPLE